MSVVHFLLVDFGEGYLLLLVLVTGENSSNWAIGKSGQSNQARFSVLVKTKKQMPGFWVKYAEQQKRETQENSKTNKPPELINTHQLQCKHGASTAVQDYYSRILEHSIPSSVNLEPDDITHLKSENTYFLPQPYYSGDMIRILASI